MKTLMIVKTLSALLSAFVITIRWFQQGKTVYLHTKHLATPRKSSPVVGIDSDRMVFARYRQLAGIDESAMELRAYASGVAVEGYKKFA